uniref:FAD dependent oxidoreductase domain-containing protein n=1 Tax=Strigamia maritima TaxID=126957 RepID=T1IJ22_STRMM
MGRKVCVVGAGVNGLCTAVLIQELLPNVSVTIVADKTTTDTLSDGAAGLFRVSDSTRGPSPESIKTWTRDSYLYYKSIATSPQSDDAGIKEISGYILAEEAENITKNLLLEDILPIWRKLDEDELKPFPGNWKYGSTFKTVLVECRRFLPWMTKKFQTNGGKILKQRINSLDELFGECDVVVNCSGFGAKYLCNDSRVVPIRGQVIKVKAPWIKEFVYGDYDTYICPGFDFVTLGGTRQFDSYDTKMNTYNSKEIWERCCKLVPNLKNAKIEYEFVGLRPYRDEIRVELEYLTRKNSTKFPVVHNYGHGGYGVSLAYGCAKNTAQLVKACLVNTDLQSKL